MQSPVQILILGNHRNALTVARRLGRQNRVILGAADGPGRVERSRFVEEAWSLPNATSDEFPGALESRLQSLPDIPVLFPIGDDELFGLLRVPSVMEGRVSVVMPAPEVVAVCLDKAANVDLASRLQIPQARYRKVQRLSQLQDAVREVGCPCIIKSDHQLSLAFGKKAYRVGDVDELTALVASEPEPQHGLIVQAMATGLRHNVYFAAEKGRLIGAMEARVLRTTIFDGSGFTVESGSVPMNDALRQYTERLVDALGYQGIGNTQFLVDRERDEISFLEISPRMGAAFAVTVPCGFDFAQAGLSLAVGDPVSPDVLPLDYPAGCRLAWTYGDLVGLIAAVRSREISGSQAGIWLWRIIRAAVTADIHPTWSWRDPRPALANLSAPLRKLFTSARPI
jgi:predicted ATP-grasp superfamily ATP-dependent carboligase